VAVKRESLSLEDDLEASILQATEGNKEVCDDGRFIKKQMAAYECSKKRTEHLDLLFRALSTIHPTSVEAERAFSGSSCFLSKHRSMSDRMLDALCFLRANM